MSPTSRDRDIRDILRVIVDVGNLGVRISYITPRLDLCLGYFLAETSLASFNTSS